MPNWGYIAIIVLILYIIVSIALYYLQEYFIFKPEKLGSLTKIWFVDGKWNMNHYDKLNLSTN